MPVQRMTRRLKAWYDRSEPRVLVSILLMVVGVWGFAVLADEVMEGATHTFDNWVVQSLHDPNDPLRPLGPNWLPRLAEEITALGSLGVLTLMTFIIAGFLWLNGKRRLMAVMLVAILGGLIISIVLKQSFGRPRPEGAAEQLRFFQPSFPSGHSMMSAVVYLTLGMLLDTVVSRRRLKLYVLGVALMLTGLIGVTRVYLGMHYPTDVLAGWTAGLVWSLLWWLVVRWLQRRRSVESEPVDEGGE